MALPNWVRARGMSIYQMSIMGGTAAGAALWGQVASMVGVRGSLMVAAASGVACMLLVQRLVRDRQIEEDLSPSKAFQRPEVHLPEAGRVVVTIEYQIEPTQAEASAPSCRKAAAAACARARWPGACCTA
jgi:MFS family permease